MHPRSKHWHMLDYVITRHRHAHDVLLTRVMRGATCWSDHCLVWSTVPLKTAQRRHWPQRVSRKKLDVRGLGFTKVAGKLQDALFEALSTAADSSVEQEWTSLRDTVYETASQVVGFRTTKHHNWFDDQDAEAQQMLDELHRSHLAWMKDKNNNSLKSAYTRVKQRVQSRLRQMQEKWWKNKAAELQEAADSHDMRRFYSGIKAVYGPKVSGCVPVWSADSSSLLTDRNQILQRWPNTLSPF